jgi:hypothetical protein
MPAKPLRLPKRFHAATTEEAYRRLRSRNERYNRSNDSLLTALLERLDDDDPHRLDAADGMSGANKRT